MNTAKINILKETFEKRFDIERFKKFTREFFNEPEMFKEIRHTGIWKEYADHINAYYTVAKYIDNEDNNLIVMAVELKRNTSIDRARSMQRNFISKVLDDNSMEAAIVAFYTEDEPSWRLSFVRLDYSFTEKGIDLDLTPARRYSYLVGENEPNHTAQEQLLPLFEDDKHNPILDEIEKAFSVEKVTKDFFNQYKEKYLDIKEYLEQDESFISETKKLGFEVDKFAEQFAKKLMGQLAFLYFLQKKGWLGVRIMPASHTISMDSFKAIYNEQDSIHKSVLGKVFKNTKDENMKLSSKELFMIDEHEAEILSDCFIGTKYDMPWGSGNRRFIREIFNFCKENTNKNFFDDYLEPFFYDALNKKRKNQYFKRFNCKIPFLNGGLFEPLEGYHWRDVNFEIPNELFSNKNEKGREADGILDIFDRFNFTMNEDEPLEKEVAVDPEMLGKIFENLLDVSDRKSKGAFYTPREIVHYMCQESLVNYLVNEVNVPYGDIKEFILYGELIRDADSRKNVGFSKQFTIKQSIFDNIVNIDDALKNVKVADPAVGSGAFPLGMLNEIVRARNNITEYIIRKDKEGLFGKEYGEEFIRKWRSPYKMKWDTIKNSIFAVDIEPSAVDIAKLRLWLSVVVEQEIDDENIEPHPLPNLDMNIHVGNSLIDEYEGIKLFDESILTKNDNKKDKKVSGVSEQLRLFFDSDEILKEMFEKQSQYFDEANEKNKRDLKERIDELRDQLIVYKLRESGNKEALEKYSAIKHQKSKPYFIWQLEFAKVFQDKGGFDIVIGNPPYVGESGNKEIFRPISKTEFGKKYYIGKMDLFYFFFHIALDIGNKNCEIALITTNYYPTAFGAKRLRKDLKERSSIRRLINFNELKIFDSAKGQHNMITILSKNRDSKIIANTCITNRCGDANSKILNFITSDKDSQSIYYQLAQDNIYEGDENYIRINGVSNNSINSIDSILSKMSKLELQLSDIAEINQGVVTGCDYISGRNIKKITKQIDIQKNDGIFVLDLKNPRDREILSGFNEGKEILKDFYKNSDIKRYWCNIVPQKKLIYYNGQLDESKYPDIMNHMLKYKEILEARIKTYNEKYHWTAIHRPRDPKIFNGCKLVVPYRAKKNTFAYNEVEWFCRSDAYVITEKDTKYSLKYLIALLNSKPYYLWLYYKGKRKGEVLELFQVPLSELPIKSITEAEQEKYINIVDNILDITMTKDYLKNIEKQKIVIELEKKIDEMVFDLYGFTKEEIKIIEEHYERNV